MKSARSKRPLRETSEEEPMVAQRPNKKSFIANGEVARSSEAAGKEADATDIKRKRLTAESTLAILAALHMNQTEK